MLPEINLELTLEQKFQMQVIESSVRHLPREELEKLLIDSTRLLMVKDNVVRDLLKGNSILMAREFENPM